MESREALHEENRKQTNVDPDDGRNPASACSSKTEGKIRNLKLAPDEGRRVTLEEYWAKWYENPYPDIDVSYEWNNGILEAKPMPNEPQLGLYNWFLDLLRRYLATHGIAKVINLETGFVLTMADPAEPSGQREAVRKPDIGLILNSNPVSWGRIDQRHFEGVCDMLVEAVFDSTQAEVLRDTEEKTRDYALAGVKEYFILDPSGEHMRFYRLARHKFFEEIQPDDEGVIPSETLPGFQFRLRDLYELPDLEDLALDDVYAAYALPRMRAAVDRAKSAEERAAVAENRVQELQAELDQLRGRRS